MEFEVGMEIVRLLGNRLTPDLKQEIGCQKVLTLEKNFAERKKNCDKEGTVRCESTLNEAGQIRGTASSSVETSKDKIVANFRQLSRLN